MKTLSTSILLSREMARHYKETQAIYKAIPLLEAANQIVERAWAQMPSEPEHTSMRHRTLEVTYLDDGRVGISFDLGPKDEQSLANFVFEAAEDILIKPVTENEVMHSTHMRHFYCGDLKIRLYTGNSEQCEVVQVGTREVPVYETRCK